MIRRYKTIREQKIEKACDDILRPSAGRSDRAFVHESLTARFKRERNVVSAMKDAASSAHKKSN